MAVANVILDPGGLYAIPAVGAATGIPLPKSTIFFKPGTYKLGYSTSPRTGPLKSVQISASTSGPSLQTIGSSE